MFKIKPTLYADINNAEVHDDDSTREEPPPSLSIINCSIDSKLSGKNFINTSDSFPDESQYYDMLPSTRSKATTFKEQMS